MTSTPITLTSNKLCVTILPFGAALVAVRFTGSAQNMVLGFADPLGQRKVHPFAGPLVGPIANRIAKGRITINGDAHQMQRNENGCHTLHSGDAGLHNRLWQITAQTEAELALTCTLSDGENGLPGNRQITATYSLSGARLSLALHAKSDQDTVMNIAPHAYWNLDGHPDISRHRLQVDAQSYLPVGKDMIPSGAICPVARTPFDFTQPAAIPMADWLDVNYCLSHSPTRAIKQAAILRGSNGTALTVFTTAPGLQVYNGAHLPSSSVAMADCPPIAPYSAIALEPQGWPDAPNQPGFPSIMMGPDAPYTQTSVFHLRPATTE